MLTTSKLALPAVVVAHKTEGPEVTSVVVVIVIIEKGKGSEHTAGPHR